MPPLTTTKFKETDMNDRKKTFETQPFYEERLAKIIECNSVGLGLDSSDIAGDPIENEVPRVPANSSRHVLSAEDAQLLSDTLENPPALTTRAVRVAALYHDRVVYAD